MEPILRRGVTDIADERRELLSCERRKEATIVPSEPVIRATPEERRQIADLAKLLEAGELSFATASGEPVSVPPAVRDMLSRALPRLAEGGGVVVVGVGTELTPRQAAELLGVSRPFLVRLLKDGRIPSRTVGTHRRIAIEDVLEYKRKRDEERRRALDLLARESEEMGLR